MRTSGSTIGGRNPIAFGRDFAVSDAARIIVSGAKDKATEEFASSISFGDHLCRILGALLTAKEEYSEENQDETACFDEQSFDVAKQFALSLPADIAVPEVDVVATGHVVFTWDRGPRQTFSVMIGGRGELFYAGLYGARRTHGVEYLDGDVPATIIDNIARVSS